VEVSAKVEGPIADSQTDIPVRSISAKRCDSRSKSYCGKVAFDVGKRKPKFVLLRLHLPNVKDEPRRDLARLVPHHDFHSVASFRKQIPSHEA